ncbi:elongation factor P [Candidatus Izimaplasma bacterium ZiA1]|uniref:elongation factor P n=1 Tax=Candidatus Izimoplasma sp. ZiA1 TaxID=2024899 RepID=UPI000BAA647D|nr:elongation factor P [Candidatus Izimaplasma bacterium ZiA1]
MITTNDFKTGMTIKSEGNLFSVIEFQHVKPGKGSAFVRSKLRNLRSGAVLDKTWRAGEKVENAHIDKDKMSYLYSMGETYVFMNNDTYEQVEIPGKVIEYQLNFLIENMEVNVISYEGEILGVDIPEKVTLLVTESDPAVKGNTATSATKDAILETGFKIQVPLFVEEGDKVVVNTSTGKYDTRA